MSAGALSNNRAGQLLAEAISLLAVSASARSDDVTGPAGNTIRTPFSTMNQADWVEAVQLWNRHGRELIATLPPRNCPACNSMYPGRQIFESYDGYAFHECTDCRCWFVPHEVDAALFERFFAEHPHALEVTRRSFEKRQSEENRQADLVRFDAYFKMLQPLLSSHARYLDIGCGLGNSLVSARASGMDGYGVESSAECLRLARKAGLEVYDSLAALPDRQFGLISFWESLEHISDPQGMLASCDAMLSEDGLIAFSVPNLNSPLLRAQRADCSVVHGGYDTPGHINLFAPQHLQQLFDRAGFELLHLDGQYSANLPELVSYMLGLHGGASSLLDSEDVTSHLSEVCRAILDSIGVPVALLERASLTAPILFGIACRKSRKADFQDGLLRLRNDRQTQILSQAMDVALDISNAGIVLDPGAANTAEGQLLNFLASRRDNDIQRLTETLADRARAVDAALQEVALRDQLLAATQGEVNKRDAMLVEQSEEMQRLRGALADRGQAVNTALEEVALRDQLLAATQGEVNKRDAMLVEQSEEMQRLRGALADRGRAVDAALQEVTLRDQLLAATQGEVNKRDRMLVEQSEEMGRLRDTLAAGVQAEAALRAQYSSLQQEHGRLGQLLKASQDEIRHKDSLLADGVTERNHLNDEVARRDNLLAEEAAERERLSVEISQRSAEADELKSTIERLVGELGVALLERDDRQRRIDHFEQRSLVGVLRALCVTEDAIRRLARQITKR